jgi:hypothetical protein
VTAHEVRKLAERLAKAEALVQDGAVFPLAGLDGYAVVCNGDGTQMYLVRHETGREHCTCPDFQHRQGKHGQPCKHLLAAQLAEGAGAARGSFRRRGRRAAPQGPAQPAAARTRSAIRMRLRSRASGYDSVKRSAIVLTTAYPLQLKTCRVPESPSQGRNSGSDQRLPLLLATSILSS